MMRFSSSIHALADAVCADFPTVWGIISLFYTSCTTTSVVGHPVPILRTVLWLPCKFLFPFFAHLVEAFLVAHVDEGAMLVSP